MRKDKNQSHRLVLNQSHRLVDYRYKEKTRVEKVHPSDVRCTSGAPVELKSSSTEERPKISLNKDIPSNSDRPLDGLPKPKKDKIKFIPKLKKKKTIPSSSVPSDSGSLRSPLSKEDKSSKKTIPSSVPSDSGSLRSPLSNGNMVLAGFKKGKTSKSSSSVADGSESCDSSLTDKKWSKDSFNNLPVPKSNIPDIPKRTEAILDYWNSKPSLPTHRKSSVKTIKAIIRGVASILSGKTPQVPRFHTEELKKCIDRLELLASDPNYSTPQNMEYYRKVRLPQFLEGNPRAKDTRPIILRVLEDPQPLNSEKMSKRAATAAKEFERLFRERKGGVKSKLSSKDKVLVNVIGKKVDSFLKEHITEDGSNFNYGMTVFSCIKYMFKAVEHSWNGKTSTVSLNYYASDRMFTDTLPGYLAHINFMSDPKTRKIL